MRPSCKCKFRHIDDTHTTHTLIQTFMQTSLLTHTYTFHPACELSQTNTRWLFCSWTGWPVSTAEGGTEEGAGGSGSGSRPAGGPHLAKRITSLCLASHPLSAHRESLSLGSGLCAGFPNSNVRCVGLYTVTVQMRYRW